MNAVQCLTCHTTIRSKTVHDFCGCGCASEDTRVYVDGGEDYRRRVYGGRARWREVLEDGTVGPAEGPGNVAQEPLDA